MPLEGALAAKPTLLPGPHGNTVALYGTIFRGTQVPGDPAAMQIQPKGPPVVDSFQQRSPTFQEPESGGASPQTSVWPGPLKLMCGLIGITCPPQKSVLRNLNPVLGLGTTMFDATTNWPETSNVLGDGLNPVNPNRYNGWSLKYHST